MLEGKTTSSNKIIENRKEMKNVPIDHNGQPRPIQNTTIFESESATDGVGTDENEENPDGDVDRIKEEMNITISDRGESEFSQDPENGHETSDGNLCRRSVHCGFALLDQTINI